MKNNLLKTILDNREQVDLGTQYLAFNLYNHIFALEANKVIDVQKIYDFTPIPHSPQILKGAINVRGRIVYFIDITEEYYIKASEVAIRSNYGIIFEYGKSLYALRCNKIADVYKINAEQVLPKPENLSDALASITKGIFEIENKLIIILDVDKIIENCISKI